MVPSGVSSGCTRTLGYQSHSAASLLGSKLLQVVNGDLVQCLLVRGFEEDLRDYSVASGFRLSSIKGLFPPARQHQLKRSRSPSRTPTWLRRDTTCSRLSCRESLEGHCLDELRTLGTHLSPQLQQHEYHNQKLEPRSSHCEGSQS